MTITEERLAEIEKLALMATPAPWESCWIVSGPQKTVLGITAFRGNKEYVIAQVDELSDRPNQDERDIAFITHARQAVPDLLAEVRRLRKAQEATRNTTQEAEEVAGAIKANVMRALGVK